MDVNESNNANDAVDQAINCENELTSSDKKIINKLLYLMHFKNVLEDVCMNSKDKYLQLLATVAINNSDDDGINVVDVVKILISGNVRAILTSFGAYNETYSVSEKKMNSGDVVRVFFLCRKKQLLGNYGLHLITNGNKSFLTLFKFSDKNEFEQITHSTLFDDIESHFNFGYIGYNTIGYTILDEYVKSFINKHCCKKVLPVNDYNLICAAKKAARIASLACADAKRARIELITAFKNGYVSNHLFIEGLIDVLAFHEFGHTFSHIIYKYRDGRISTAKMADRLIAFFKCYEDDEDVQSVSSQSVVLPDKVSLPSLDGSSQYGYAPNPSLASGSSSQFLDFPASSALFANFLPSRLYRSC
jgi:hypothetical protein